MSERNTEATEAALRLLEYADNTEKKLREKLLRKGFSPSECCAALEYVKRVGALDDRRLMERTVERLAKVKLYGRRRIVSELFAKGFVRADIDGFDFSEYDFAALCAERIKKTARRYPEREKMYAALLRYGYASADVSAAFALISRGKQDE